MSPRIGRRARLAIWGGTLLFLLHFGFTVIYTVPGVPVPEAAHKASYRYMVPMFHQGWQLFAPNVPGYQVEWRVKYKPTNSGWTEWSHISDLQPDARMHYALAKMSGPVTTALNDSIKGLYYLDEVPQYDRVETSGAYRSMVYFFIKEYQQRNGTKPDSLQLEMEYLFTPDLHGQPVQEDLILTFPPIEIPEKL